MKRHGGIQQFAAATALGGTRLGSIVRARGSTIPASVRQRKDMNQPVLEDIEVRMELKLSAVPMEQSMTGL